MTYFQQSAIISSCQNFRPYGSMIHKPWNRNHNNYKMLATTAKSSRKSREVFYTITGLELLKIHFQSFYPSLIVALSQHLTEYVKPYVIHIQLGLPPTFLTFLEPYPTPPHPLKKFLNTASNRGARRRCSIPSLLNFSAFNSN